MADEQGQAQGATQAQGAEGTTEGGEKFDKDRALATIKAQRESEDKAKSELAEARTRLKELEDTVAKTEAEKKAEADAKLSESEKTAQRIAELEKKLADTETGGRSRVAKAALKASAAALGAVYPDDIPSLIDMDKVKFDRDGEPTNADELVTELKKSRPNHFTERKPGSGDGGPRGEAPGGKRDMNDLMRAARK